MNTRPVALELGEYSDLTVYYLDVPCDVVMQAAEQEYRKFWFEVAVPARNEWYRTGCKGEEPWGYMPFHEWLKQEKGATLNTSVEVYTVSEDPPQPPMEVGC